MEISVREYFRQGESKWDGYITWIGLSYLTEVRTIDAALNLRVGEPIPFYSPNNDVLSIIASLPKIDTIRNYYLLAINLEDDITPTLPDNIVHLGYDLADETRTSSLLNCGIWEGKLAPIAQRLNQYGLLTLADARIAEQVLLEEWGEDEPHAWADVWALYEIQIIE